MDSLRASVYKYSTFNSAWYTESALVRDPYTGKKTMFPASYFNAYAMAVHCANNGFGIPFAGKYYTWTGFIPGTMTPQTSSLDVLKSEFQNRVNQMFEDGTGIAKPYEQLTTQSLYSQLSELNNVHILKYMIRIALVEAEATRWDFSNTTEISNYQKSVTDAISLDLAGLYDTVTVTCSQESANGAGASRILAQINVTFKNILKGITYQFFIN
jgi:hypothetical protein